MEIKCNVYKSDMKSDTYLYLKAGVDQDDLPEALILLLGEITQFLSLALKPDSKLAQANISDVLNSLHEQGYYLQMPPGAISIKQAPGSGFVQ